MRTPDFLGKPVPSILSLLTLFLIATNLSYTQTITIRGKVIDEHSKEPLPFVSLGIPGTQYSTYSNPQGEFELRLPRNIRDSIFVQTLGYTTKKFAPPLRDTFLVIEMTRHIQTLPEVVIRGSEQVNPALIIMRKVWERKKQHQIRRQPYYGVEIHNRMELDLTNLSREAFKKYKWLQPFSFVLDMMDTTSYVKPFLPVFLIETISDYAYQRSPKKEKERIRAVQISGVKNTTVTEYLGGMYQKIDVYENWISIFDVDFVSPLHTRGEAYYKYYLVDSGEIHGFKAYRIDFRPKRKGVNTFQGNLWVIDSIWAVAIVNMEMSKWARINFVERMSVYQKFYPFQVDGQTHWFLQKDKIIVDFITPAKEHAIGFIGRRTTTYRNYTLDPHAIQALLTQEEDVTVAKDAYDYTPEAWDTLRHEPLEHNEQMVYHLVDTIQQVPQFRTFVDIVKIIVSGYKEFGPIEIGPYFSLISSDEVEGIRLRLGMRTTEKISERFRIEVYGAYGFQDKNVKYGGELLWIVQDEPWRFLRLRAHHDLNLEAERWGEIDRDNILALGMKRKGIRQGLIYEDLAEITFEQQLNPSWSIMIGSSYVRYTPTFAQPFPNNEHRYPIVTSRLIVALRFAHREKFIRGKYFRVSLGSKYPVITATAYIGIPGIGESQYQYYHLRTTIYDVIKFKPKQRIRWEIQAGKVFGENLPFLLLHTLDGNWTYYYNPYAFNLMAPYEFLTDMYVTCFVNWHLRGYILHRIPLLRKLDFREFAILRAGWGQLSQQNYQLNAQVYDFQTFGDLPYVEVGVGIENILKVVRLLAIWRLTYLSSPFAQPFGLFGSFYLTF